MKVAIVHDWLVAPGGAEKVLEQIIECFPDADLFSLVDFLEDRRPLGGKPVTTSFIQRLPFARRRYRAYLPLMPLAIEQFDLSGLRSDHYEFPCGRQGRAGRPGSDACELRAFADALRVGSATSVSARSESDARAEIVGRARIAPLSARLGFAFGEQRRPV